jgi:hypothetical protein
LTDLRLSAYALQTTVLEGDGGSDQERRCSQGRIPLDGCYSGK